MAQKFRTFSVSPANQAGSMAIKQVVDGNIGNSLPAAPTAMTVDRSGASPMLIVYDAGGSSALGYTLDAGSPNLNSKTSFNIGKGWDFIEAFVDNNSPYLMCYRASDGTFAFYKLTNPLGTPVTFSLTNNPGMSKGFTTVKPFPAREGPGFLGYSQSTGSVAIYLYSPASSTVRLQWAHQWARGWTRFAFFQLGGETFFFKTNVLKLNVNIDHVLDGLTPGTVEVGTNLVLENALAITVVEPLTLANGDPHFVACMPDGTTTLSRFNGNCLGWTQLASWNSLPGATHTVPYLLGADAYILFA